MKKDQATGIDNEYFKVFANGTHPDYGEAKRLALHQLVDRKGTSKHLKTFGREYLKQIAAGVTLTQDNSPAHKAWLALSDKERDIFWNTVGDGAQNTPYRKAQRTVLRRIANR